MIPLLTPAEMKAVDGAAPVSTEVLVTHTDVTAHAVVAAL